MGLLRIFLWLAAVVRRCGCAGILPDNPGLPNEFPIRPAQIPVSVCCGNLQANV
jgi:hypothetical protein